MTSHITTLLPSLYEHSTINTISVKTIFSFYTHINFLQPLKLSIATSTRKSSSEASKKTIQRRSFAVESFRKEISSTHDEDQESTKLQQIAELKRINDNNRSIIIQEAGMSIDIPPEQGLAMKTELGLPWNKIRHLRRY